MIVINNYTCRWVIWNNALNKCVFNNAMVWWKWRSLLCRVCREGRLSWGHHSLSHCYLYKYPFSFFFIFSFFYFYHFYFFHFSFSNSYRFRFIFIIVILFFYIVIIWWSEYYLLKSRGWTEEKMMSIELKMHILVWLVAGFYILFHFFHSFITFIIILCCLGWQALYIIFCSLYVYSRYPFFIPFIFFNFFFLLL